MDMTLQTGQNIQTRIEKIQNNGTNIFYFFSLKMAPFALHTFLKLKTALK